DLKQVVPAKREILRGIRLSLFHGAKIGVLGANGAGKSSLLRIMAGVDDDFLGEAWAADGLRVGYLPQEPQLDPTKDVRGNVDDGVADTRALLERFEAVSTRLGEPIDGDEMDKLLDEQARLQDRIDAVNAWDLDRTVELAMAAMRFPHGTAYDALLNESFERQAAALEIAIPPGPRLGDVVVEADHLAKAYGDRVLIEDLSFKLPRGGIVGVIGPNGAGKTTLFRMIAGQEKPD